MKQAKNGVYGDVPVLFTELWRDCGGVPYCCHKIGRVEQKENGGVGQ